MPVLNEIYIKKNVFDLIPFPSNPRIHSDFQIKQLSDFIERVGYIDDIIIDENDMILAGHGRALAAMKIKMNVVPCKQISGLSEAEKKAYVIADNKLALNSSWDEDLLKHNVDEILGTEEFDLTEIQAIGFSLDEFRSMDVHLFPDTSDISDIPEFTPDLPDDDVEQNTNVKDLTLTVKFETPESQQELFLELNDRGYKVKI